MKSKRRICVRCGELKQCPNRIDARAACSSCFKKYRSREGECEFCHRLRQLHGLRLDGKRVCASCRAMRTQPHGPCAQCGAIGSLKRGLCSAHYWAVQKREAPIARCARCHQRRSLMHGSGLCHACYQQKSARGTLEKRLENLFGGAEARAHPQVEALSRYLMDNLAPMSALRCLRNLNPQITDCLRRMHTNGVSAEQLRALAGVRGGRRFLRLCRLAGVVAPPCVNTEYIERALKQYAELSPEWIGTLLCAYWERHLLDLIEMRSDRKTAFDPRLTGDRAHLNVCCQFLQHVSAAGFTVASMTQQCVNRYLRAAPASQRHALARFLDWLRRNYRMRAITVPPARPSSVPELARESYLMVLHRARTDETLPLTVRVALLLIALCVRSLRDGVRLTCAAIRRLSVDSIEIDFGRGISWPIQGPDAVLIVRAAEGNKWLFPSSMLPGRPVTATGFARRIHREGITVNLRALRCAALRELLAARDFAEVAHALGATRATIFRWSQRFPNLARSLKRRLAAAGR